MFVIKLQHVFGVDSATHSGLFVSSSAWNKTVIFLKGCFTRKKIVYLVHCFFFDDSESVFFFSRLFPTELFEMFIDVGHYVRDITPYEALQAKVSLFSVRHQYCLLQ